MLSLAIPNISQKHSPAFLVHQSAYNNLHYPSDINRQHNPSMHSSYHSNSPSPPPVSADNLLPHNSPEDSQDHFLHSALPEYTPEVSLPQDHLPNKYHSNSTQANPLPLLEHRRMSEPAALSGPALYATSSAVDHSSPSRYPLYNNTNNTFAYSPPAGPHRSSSLYPPHLHRGASTGSLRDLRQHHSEFPPNLSHQAEWKQDEGRHADARHAFYDNRGDGFDEPISPLQPNFSGGLVGSPTSGMPYSPLSDNPYGPSPPGTGTSTSSSVAHLSASGLPCSPSLSISHHLQRSLSTPNVSGDSSSIDRKTYSFVALPGNAMKKRPRRRYDEIERLYQCSWPDCNKSYGTLNHLNAHVTMQKHGTKRTPDEFKEMRKQWRKAKKEMAATSGVIRRESYGDLYDDHSVYDHRYISQQGMHSMHHVSRGHGLHDDLGLQSSMPIGMAERYSVGIDDIRYPASHERDDGSGLGGGYGEPMTARQRYSNGLPSSWHGGSSLSRSNMMHQQQHHHDQYISSSDHGLAQHAHHSQLPQLTIGSSFGRVPTPPPHSAPAHSHDHHRGLPQNSTLLTPLSNYQHAALIPPLQNGVVNDNTIYTAEGYEVYDSDSTGRPGTGQTNLSVSQGSGDEYDPHSQ